MFEMFILALLAIFFIGIWLSLRGVARKAPRLLPLVFAAYLLCLTLVVMGRGTQFADLGVWLLLVVMVATAVYLWRLPGDDASKGGINQVDVLESL